MCIRDRSLAAAFMGGDRWGFGPYLVLWAGLTGGAVVGALTFGRLGLAALWPAAAFAFLLAVVTRFSRAA